MADDIQLDDESPEADDAQQAPTKPELTPDFDSEIKKWKALARKHEQQAKANAEAATRLRDIENAGKSKEERLQAQLEEAASKARHSTIKALQYEVAYDKGLPKSLAKFLPEIDNEADMMQAADELLEAMGSTGKVEPPTRQPRSNLTNPLRDDDYDPNGSREALIASMLGKPRP
jgi:hypothetical protein